MSDNQNESVIQDQTSGTSNDQIESRVKPTAQDSFKKDMLRYKDEAANLREQLNSIEMEKQTKKGNFESVITKLKEELAEQKRTNAGLKVNYAEKSLNDSIKAQAMSKGLKGVQVDAFMRLVDSDEKQLVEFDDKFNVKQDDVNNIVENHLKRYSDIFKTKVNVADASPRSGASSTDTRTKFDVNKASAAEIAEHLKKNF
jgi:hypothetical protein